MSNSKDESTLHEVYRYYIRGDYHCDVCPYSWEERGEEDADAGCYLFGELRDTCRLIRNPISRMIVNARMNDADGRYDFWTEVSNDIEIAEEIQKGFEKQAQDLEQYFPEKNSFLRLTDAISMKSSKPSAQNIS